MEAMIEHDAEVRKAICANLISIKSRKEDYLSQTEKKSAKDPPEDVPHGYEEVKEGLGF